ncbi:MAG TPA: SAM-dependent chlorinase/fluorinase [Polyangiaceae bacterium]|nr:SAM-dependent chlorinase/fluorinase [Polyangiaceae bacterium]
MSAAGFRPGGAVTLLTDFGTRDPFVGLMKGVIVGLAPAARLVDLGHESDAFDVAAAAFWLARSYAYFPPGTVHLAVVDPGVGSARRAIAAVAGGHAFVGPDNGLLAGALAGAGPVEAVELDPSRAGRGGDLSATFHGRDLFAPAAARLAAGAALGELGRPLDPASLAPSPLPSPRREGGALAGEVVVVDRFGNLITNLEAGARAAGSGARVEWAGGELRLVRTYAEAARGAPLALVNAFGVVEIAVREGSAAAAFGLGRGSPVRLFGAGGG